ncbi:hypothetical protein E5288_WYG005895 [Bos mutus]|uniref:Uncharacterized protein n=1 Tax=Bos mutus TaxID=72004 RepID=A0A6B0QXN1_9CETA|nr:hypothetical protein [Bos mutus]
MHTPTAETSASGVHKRGQSIPGHSRKVPRPPGLTHVKPGAVQLSSSNATEPPLFPSKLLLPTAQHAATEQAVVMEPECGVLALRQHQKRRSVYPRRPYLKPKQKAPLHPRPFSIQDPGEGQTVVGGHSICRQR